MGPGYKAMLGTHEQCKYTSPIKQGKREKPRGKKPPPKREMKRGCMDGWSNKDPPIMTYIQYIQERMMRGREIEQAPPKRRMSTNDCSDEEANP